MGGQTQALIGDADGGKAGRVMALQFKDGSEIPTDLVVMAVGIRPNTALAETMRLHVNRGIVVSDTLQTVTDARIYSRGGMRGPPRHRLRAGGAAVRAGQGRGQPSGAVRHRALHRLAHLHQAQGHGH
jgi:pyruvate/2-oxoglutarate dehydrogenase complex dihydrolipoamide dehydrogenase (E3) component